MNEKKLPERELKDLLGIAEPTMAELAEAEELLTAIITESQVAIDTLADEDRARVRDRFLDEDDGSEQRAALLANALKNQSDASFMRADVMAMMAAEVCRVQKAADDAAWEVVQSNLAERLAKFVQIEKLVDEVAALYISQHENWLAARAAMPVKVDPGQWNYTQSTGPGQIAAVIVANLSYQVGNPIGALQIQPDQLAVFAQVARLDGLAKFVAPADQFLLSHKA